MTLFNTENALLSIESLSHSKIMIIEHAQMEKLHAKFPKFEHIHRMNLQKRIAALQKKDFWAINPISKRKI